MRPKFIQSLLAMVALVAFTAIALQSRDGGAVIAAPDDMPAPTVEVRPVTARELLQLALLQLPEQSGSRPAAPPATQQDVKSARSQLEAPRGEKPGPKIGGPAEALADRAAADDQRLNGIVWEPQLVERCMEVAHDIDPDLGSQLGQIREKSPKEFQQTIEQGQVGRRLYSMAQLKQRDPDLYRLKISEVAQTYQINRVAANLRLAMRSEARDPGLIAALNEQLRGLLQIQMAMSLKARGEYLCRIEDQVKALREEIEHDAANFRTIIDVRMQQLILQPTPDETSGLVPASGQQAVQTRPAPR